MAGHSKWANIKNRKAAQDKKRSGAFTKLAKDITVAARSGADPDSNFRLRLAIQKARQGNMPKDNIDRAIKRGTGELAGDIIEEVVYEGYGPAGVAVVIEASTDNKNRTAAHVRATFNKLGGSLGSSNSVMFMFDRRGVIKIARANIHDNDEFMLQTIDTGALDVIFEEDEVVVYTAMQDFQKVQEALVTLGYETTHAELEYVPNTFSEISDDEDYEKIERFMDMMLDDNDVNNVFLNIKS